MVASTDPRGFVTATAYDDIARTEAITTPDLATTTVAHDPAGRVVGVTDPLGFASRAQYDLLGRATSAADPLGNATKYRYAVNGAADLETDPLNRVTARYADAFGRTASVADALARTTAFTYDRADRTATVTDPRGTVGATTYDALGRTSKVTEAAGTALERSTSWAYTAAGDLASVTDPRGFVTAFGYDSGGRRTSVTGASGQPEALTVTTGYDLLDRPTGVTRPGGRTTGYAYDALGQLVRVDEAVGTSLARATTLAYDAAGHRTSATEPMGRVSSTAYDAMGRPATATDPRAGVTKYAYDLAGRLKSLTDPNSNVTAWGYDAAGRRTSATDPLGKSTAYAYDAAGQLVGVTDRTGRRKALSYDAAGQLVGEDWFDAANAKLDARAFAYDAGGNLTSAANNAGTYALAYDALNRVTTVAEPFGATLAFGYDAGGNRTSVTDGFGGVTASAYDGLGRLTGRHLSGTGVTPAKVAWGYDAAGDATTLTRSAKAGAAWAVAAATAMAFDALGRTVSIATTAGGGAAVSASAYAYDAGDRLASETVNGVTRSYGYDVGDQVTSDGGAAVTYDAAGNRTSGGTTVTAGNRLSSDGAWAYAYDAEGRVASKSAGAVTWAYGYDLNGQLTSAASGGTSVAYAYDAFGNRVQRSETAGGATATELFAYDGWDTARPGAVGGENFDAWADLSGTTNALTTRRVSGGGFDAPLFKETAAGVAGWYDVDHLGSVRKVFDNTGTVTGSRDYAAFGAATAASGTGLDRYGYTAREWDAALSLQYSRARMYDPGTGRWTGEDPAGFAAGDADLHRYVGNDSTGRTDPSGLVDVPSHWHHRIPKALFGGEHGELLKSLLSGAFVHGPGNGWYLTDGMHSEIHGNYNGATGGDTYTKKWEQFLDKYPNATREQIFAFRDRIEIEFGYRTVDPKTGKVVPVPGRGQPVTSVDGMPYTEGGSASADPAKDSRMCQSERDKFRKSNKVKGYQPSVADLATDAAIKRSQQAKAAIQKLNDAIAKLAKGVKSNTTYLINNGNKGAATKGLAAVGTVLAISGPIDAAINFDSDAVMKDLIKLAQLHDKYENESQPSEKDVIYVTEFLAHLRSMLINHFGFDDASAGMAYYFWNLSYMGNYVK